jgi:hypothetical protein
MEIHALAFAHGVERADMLAALEHTVVSSHAGNGPTKVVTLGRDTHGRLLELSCVVRNEDVLIFHAAPARPAYLPLIDEVALPPVVDGGKYAVSCDGVPMTEERIAELHAEAAAGYDTGWLLLRSRPGRPAPASFGDTVLVGLSAELHHAASARASTDGTTVSELVRVALQRYFAVGADDS